MYNRSWPGWITGLKCVSCVPGRSRFFDAQFLCRHPPSSTWEEKQHER
jgi:hypothetical protein